MRREGSTDSVSYNQILGNTKPRMRDVDKLEAIHKDLRNYRDSSNKDLEHTDASIGVASEGLQKRNQSFSNQ